MEDNKKVKVRNAVNENITVNLPFIRFQREWAGRNAVFAIDMETLREMAMDPGSLYFFKRGMLVIEDAEVRMELGLETEDQKLFTLNDAQMMAMLKTDSLEKFKENLKQMHTEQRVTLAQIAIANELFDLDKNDLMLKYTEIDVAAAIKLNREIKAELQQNK